MLCEFVRTPSEALPSNAPLEARDANALGMGVWHNDVSGRTCGSTVPNANRH